MASKPGNALNLVGASGIVTWDGTATIATQALTQYYVLTGGSSANAFNQIAPSTSGQLFTSAGAAAQPVWTTSTYPGTNAVNTLLYASSANVMAALATGNNGVLITSGAGVPSISSTLPSAVQGNITAVGLLASGTVPTSLVKGSTSGSAPSAGYIGEQIRAFGNGVSSGASTNVFNITSIALTAGVWDISAVCEWAANSVVGNYVQMGISANTGSFTGTVTGDSVVHMNPPTGNYDVTTVIPAFRVTTSGSPTYYLVGTMVSSSGSNMLTYGRISAVRVG
jgi:hypothetical protein